MVSRLRQPLGPVDGAVLALTAVVSAVAQHWTGPVSLPQFVLVLAILSFAVQPISILIHELAHAYVARRAGCREVFVVIGRGPWATFSLGEVRVNFSLLSTRSVLIGGFCRYDDADVDWRSRAWIALAGPVATALTLAVALGVGAEAWHSTGATVRYLIVLTVVALVASLAVNLLPLGRVGRVMPNDGTKARAAFRLHRAGAPIKAGAQSSLPVIGTPADGAPALTGQMARRASELERQKDLARAATSVPPPT